MLRFPNPGSTIENFVSVYSAAFSRLSGQIVGLDDIVSAVVAANLATSSGYMGEAAIARSTRTDRSRDPLYNQLKMYAELFRILGWLHPTTENSLRYTFTLLGEQIVAAGRDFWPLLEECLVGIVYPTPMLSIKGEYELRPFAFILKVMAKSGGHLSRDEMIIGPLSATSDRGAVNLKAVLDKITYARSTQFAISRSIQDAALESNTQVNTLYNYTRWPIAVLRDTGLIRKGSATFADGKKYSTWYLTEKGNIISNRVCLALDFRVSDIKNFPDDERKALSFVAHYQILKRSGFDTTPVHDRIAKAEAIANKLFTRFNTDGQNILFSPFQSLSLHDIAEVFPVRTNQPKVDLTVGSLSAMPDGRDDRSHLFISPMMVRTETTGNLSSNYLRCELMAYLAQYGTIHEAANAFVCKHARDTQTNFYPLVTHLFEILGYRSDYSRAGVNYQRWDACVWVGDNAIPVEIKSPTEELFLSTKAVRQALENKVILLARGGLETQREFTSLVVGNRLPNERGEMSNLIDNVYAAYGLRLGVLDLATLANLAIRAINEGVTIDAEQLCRLKGFLNV